MVTNAGPVPHVTDTVKNENGVEEYYQEGGYHYPVRSDDDFLTKWIYFTPIIDTLVSEGRNATVNIFGLMGCVGWGLSRSARRFRKQLEQTLDRRLSAWPEVDPENWKSVFPKYYVPNSFEGDEAAKASAEYLMDRAQRSALMASGLMPA